MLDFNVIEFSEADEGLKIEVEELSMQEIAIVGISAQLPLVEDMDQFWKYIRNGVDFISEFPESRRRAMEAYAKKRNRQEGSPAYYDGAYLDEIDKFDYAFFRLSPKEASLMTPNQRLFLETAWKAVEDAGYCKGQLAGSRTGVFVGFNTDALYDYKMMIADTDPELLTLAVPGNITSIIAGRISYLLDLKGPSLCIDTACSSSLVSVHLACQAIRNQECEMAIAGSVKIHLLPLEHEVKIGIESTNARTRTFDDSSDGTGAGEGVIAFVLKPLYKAVQDGDSIYGVIKGSAVNQDGNSIGMTAPNVKSQEDVIVRAWQNAGIDPETISYIEAHGTGTKLGDPIEIDGIHRAFSRFTDRSQFVAIGSTKTNLGHLDHAAGMAGLLKAVLAMQHKQIPPSLHFHRPNQTINFIESPVFVNNRLREWKSDKLPRRCGVSAFGMSGTNCHIVLEEAPIAENATASATENVIQDHQDHILSLSAKSKSSLEQSVRQYSIRDWNPHQLADLCYTANTGRDHYEYRLAIVFRNQEELSEKLRGLNEHGVVSSDEHGIFYGYYNPAVSGMEDRHNSPIDGFEDRKEIALYYVQGAKIEWSLLYKGQRRKRIHLPTYSFEKNRCWLEASSENSLSHTQVLSSAVALTSSVQKVGLAGRVNDEYSETERLIAQIWGETLGFHQINCLSNYYEFGGDSIFALKIVNRISQQLSIHLEVADLFKHATVADLAAFVDSGSLQKNLRTDVYSSLKPVDIRVVYPLTSSQYRVYIQEQFGNIGTGNNSPFCIMVDGTLDSNRVEASFRKLVDRHESLRTAFSFVDGEVVQHIVEHVEFQLNHFKSSKDRLDAIIRDFIQPFDLAHPPLIRVGLVKISSSQHLIMIDLHHIVSDGVSSSVLIKEFCELYKGFALTALPIQYKDYSVWQQETLKNGGFEECKKYWLKRLSDDLPLLEMPTDFPRPLQKAFNGNTIRFPISSETKQKLELLAKAQNVTMHTLLFSLYTLLLHQFTRQEDMVVGTLVSGRNHRNLENVIGMFINFLPIRVQIHPSHTFKDLISQINLTIVDAYAHDYPFDQMVVDLQVKTDRSRNPLYDTMFVYHNEFNMNPTDQLKMEDDGLHFSEYPLLNPASPLDFKLDAWNDMNGELVFVLQYDTALFKESSMNQMMASFVQIAESLAEHSDLSLQQINLETVIDKPELAGKWKRANADQSAVIELAVASTFTAEPFGDYTTWWCKQFNLEVDVVFAAYNQVFQELLDPSSLLSGNKGINLVLMRFEDWIRNDSAADEVKIAKLERIYTELVQAVEKNNPKVPCFVGVFPVSVHLSFSSEMIACINDLNLRWKDALTTFENVHILELDESIAALYQVPEVFDAVKDQEGHLPFSDEFYAVMGTMIARKIVARNSQDFKVIVLDCDNTLWKGICGEDGPLGVVIERPYLELQQFMLDRYNDGMLLALCSKNNEADVWEVFANNPDMLLKKEHFVAHKINWDAKSANIRELADELNLGLDSFIFLDDSAVECSEIIRECPTVLTLQVPANAGQIPKYLQHAWAFDKFVVTDEDRKRTTYYIAESKRRSVQENENTTIEGFLQSLDLKMKMRSVDNDQVSRAAQLTQRTNQFNMSTIRRSEEDIHALLTLENTKCWGIEVEDRFGDYGFVGLVIGTLEQHAFVLDTFLLSCRVLGRQVEVAILSELKLYAQANNLPLIKALYVPSAKNMPFMEFLEKTNWEQIVNADGTTGYSLPLDRIPDKVAFIKVNVPSLNPSEIISETRSNALDLTGKETETLHDSILDHSQEMYGDWEVLGFDEIGLKHRHYLMPLQYHTGSQLLPLLAHDSKHLKVGKLAYVEASSQTEHALVEIWEEILRISPIGVQDHFFDIGGNSLQAVSLASRIHQHFSVQITLRDLFAASTIRQLAKMIDHTEQAVYESIVPITDRMNYPVTAAQKRLLVISRLDGLSTTYNQPCLFWAEGELNLDRFQSVCAELVRRHHILRTIFYWEQEFFVQRVIESINFSVEYQETNKANLKEAVERFIRPFDLSQAPLFRAGVIKFDEQHFVIMFDMHHVVADGVSISILMDEFIALYQGASLSELRIQYGDFAVWQQDMFTTEYMQKHENYWLQLFSEGIPVLNLPVDFPRPTLQTYSGNRLSFALDWDLNESIRKLAFVTSSTPYMVFLAAYNVLLAKYSGQEEIVVGSPVAGRPHADLQVMIGMFVNTLVLRNKPKGEKTFRQFLAEVKENTLQAFEHQDYPFEELVEKLNIQRDLSRNPMFDTMFVYQNMAWTTQQIEGLQFKPLLNESNRSRFDLTLELTESSEGMHIHLEYATSLFQQKTIERVFRHFVRILKEVTQTPDLQLRQIDMLDKSEKAQLLFGFNATYAEYASEKTIHQLFEEKVMTIPEQVAVVYEGSQLTYRELNEKANQLARTLRAEGVQADQLVGIMVERSLEMIIGIFGILKAGGAYVPIDPEYPQERMSYILEDSGVKLLLLQGHLQDGLSFAGKLIDLNDTQVYNKNGSNVERISSSNQLAYVIYTSGSTGKPKGVMVEHQSVIHILSQLEKEYPMLAGDAYLFKTTYAFDVSVAELFGWFAGNGKLIILQQGHEKDPTSLLRVIDEQQITHINFVPSMFNALLNFITEANVVKLQKLKYIFVAGEALSKKLVEQYHKLQLQAKLENIYGPTESTIYATKYSTHAGSGETVNVPIGKPLGNIQAWIVDTAYQMQPIGVPGELCIAGEGLARGYLNRPDLTAEKFVGNPYITGDRMYKTGDLVRWLPDGNIEYLGRIDHQVKIRGYRIELGEVEAHLRKSAFIQEAVVVALEDESGEKYLCAYFIADQPRTATELRGLLSKDLPSYMIPYYFVQLEIMPLNSNGKVNLKALPKPVYVQNKSYEPPRNNMELTLAQMWTEILGTEMIGIKDHFFEIGGHSLKAIALLTKIHQEFHVELSLKEIFQSPTIELLVKVIQNTMPTYFSSIPTAELKSNYALSSKQTNLFVLHQHEGAKTVYNLPGGYIIEGEVDRARLVRAFQSLILRHESLRTTFEIVNGEFMQSIHPEVNFQIQDMDTTEQQLENLVQSLILPFNLSQAPLMRVSLIRLLDQPTDVQFSKPNDVLQRHMLFFDMHHIVSDGISMGIMMQEFLQLYSGHPLPELRIQYKDYAEWLISLEGIAMIQKQEDYWVEALSAPIPVLQMPTDLVRPSIQSFEGNRIRHHLNASVTQKLKEVAAQCDATLYMVLFASYYVLLSKYSGQEDIIIGTPVAGRTHVDVQGIVGMFVNTLAIRNRPLGNQTFTQFLDNVKTNTIGAFDNQDIPLEQLLKKLDIPRDLSRNPLFDTLFVMQNYDAVELSADQLSIAPYTFFSPVAKFDLSLEVVDRGVSGENVGELEIMLEYAIKLFHKATAERFLADYIRILSIISSDRKIKLQDIKLEGQIVKRKNVIAKDIKFNF